MSLPKDKEYDLAVAYRIYPAISPPARGLPFSDDKYVLSEICLKSFKDSLGSLRVKVWALLDGCPPVYEKLFERYFEPNDLVIRHVNNIGNRATFSKQIDILLEQREADFVYFAEDDYFYLPGQFQSMLDLIRNHDAQFASPHDHLDDYTLDLHRGPVWVRTTKYHHWRTAGSTCLTFLTRLAVLQRYETTFRSYADGNDDCPLWLALTKERILNPWFILRYLFRDQLSRRILLKAWFYSWHQILFGPRARLWVPIPGIATHLDGKALGPCVDWRSLIEREMVVKV